MGALVVGRQSKHRDRSIMFPLALLFFSAWQYLSRRCDWSSRSLEQRDSYSLHLPIHWSLDLRFISQGFFSKFNLTFCKIFLTNFDRFHILFITVLSFCTNLSLCVTKKLFWFKQKKNYFGYTNLSHISQIKPFWLNQFDRLTNMQWF